MMGFSAPPGGVMDKDGDEEKKSVALTEKILETAVKDDYRHETLTVETESEKQAAVEEAYEVRKREIAQKKAHEEQERKDREEEEREQAEQNENAGADDNQEEDEEEEKEGDDDVEYEIYYDQGAIREAYREQRRDIFKDINDDRMDVFQEYKGLEALKKLTKYDISQYAPKDGDGEAEELATKGKKRAVILLDDDSGAEEDELAEAERKHLEEKEREDKRKEQAEKNTQLKAIQLME